MKNYFILVLLIFSYTNLFGQECGTAGLDSASFYSQPWIGNNQYLSILKDSVETNMTESVVESEFEGGVDKSAIFWVPMKVWVYHTSSIVGPNNAEIEGAIRNLNTQFAGTKNQTGMAHEHTKVQFYLKCDITYLNDPLGAFPADDGNTHWRMNHNFESGAVNIHIVQSSPTVDNEGTWNGLAHMPRFYLVPGSDVKPFTFAIEAEHIESSTMAHEMGHVLGLLHTHEGTVFNDRNEDVANCNQEPVARWRLQPGI